MGKREGEGEGEDAHSRWLTFSEWLLQRARDWPTSMYPWWASRENPLSLTGISRVPTSWLRMISPAVWLIWDSPLWAGGRGSPAHHAPFLVPVRPGNQEVPLPRDPVCPSVSSHERPASGSTLHHVRCLRHSSGHLGDV